MNESVLIKIINFLESVTVIDTETTGKDPDTCEIIEIASGFFKTSDWTISSKLFKPTLPIPPEASSKNNISNKMVVNAPLMSEINKNELSNLIRQQDTELFVAHNSEFDRLVLLSNFKKNNNNIEGLLSNSNWLCTWRLSKAIFGVDFDSMQYSLNYLRYYLNLDIDDNLIAHRADADVLICARLLERLLVEAIDRGLIDVDSDDYLGQLHKLCWDPLPVLTWPLGKHKGKKLTDIPTDYYLWAIQKLDKFEKGNEMYDLDLVLSVEKILNEREKNGDKALIF